MQGLLLQGHHVTKVYVARVQGCFPEAEQRVEAPLQWDPKLNLASVAEVSIAGLDDPELR